MSRVPPQELWLFGDDFAFGRQEARLEAALGQHATLIGRAFDPETGATQNVRDGQASRLDILLNSPYARTPACDYGHLVVELKRSSVTLGSAELNQVESDALTVGQDDRFDEQKSKWTGYPIGVGCDEFVEEKRMSQDRPPGLVVNRPGVQVWWKTWAEVVSAAGRLSVLPEGTRDGVDRGRRPRVLEGEAPAPPAAAVRLTPRRRPNSCRPAARHFPGGPFERDALAGDSRVVSRRSC